MDYIAQPKDYWIAPNAIKISLNALDNPNRIQANVASGAVIMCYIKGVDGLEYDNGHQYRAWSLAISPTYFNTNSQKYVYVAIPRTDQAGTQAMIVFPSEQLDIYGVNEAGDQIGSESFYYIWLQALISESVSGVSKRTMLIDINWGMLSTDEARDDQTFNTEWYSFSTITQTVTFLKEIIMKAGSNFANLILGGHNLTGVATAATPEDIDSDTLVVTPNYIRNKFLHKDRDDSTPYSLTVEQELRVGNRGIMNHLQSTDYTGDGMLDTGYKLWYEEGRAKLVIDDLVARGKFTVNELETRIWTYAGGNMIFSGAGSTIFFVEYLDANEQPLGYTYINQPWLLRGRALLAASLSWSKRRTIMRQLTDTERAQVVKFRCYEFSDDGTMQTRNWWQPNDIAMCQTLNKVRDKVNADGSYSGYASNTVYKRRVAGIGSKKIPMLNDDRVYDYVDLWNIYDVYGQTYINSQGQTVTITDNVKGFLNMAPSGSDPSTDWPSAGDVIVQMGNPLDTDRQAAVTIEVQGDVHGFKVYDTISDYSMENKQWVEIGYDQTTGKAKANVYGDFRFGCRESEEAQGGSYVKYNRTTKQLDIKAKINAQSTMPYNGSDTTLANIFSGLNQQIDGKVETWRQTTDPASAWTTDTERLKHVGDLWMDISANGGKKTYIYQDNGTSANPRFVWDQQDVPQAVFDGIDGKASVYATWGAWVIDNVNKLHLRDLLIPTADITESGVTYKAGKVYRCTQVTPSIVFTEVAYTDDTTFHNYVGLLLNKTWASGDDATAAAAQRAVLRAVKGDTVVDGGLLLTSLIAMRQFNGSAGQEGDPTKYTTWGGISGIYDDWSGSTHAKGHGIAAWFGGAMVDKEDVQTLPASYAKSLFRMDGSGYVADGGLSWDYNNQGKTVVTLNGDVVKAANYYLDDKDITAQLSALFDMFEKVNVAAQGQTPHYMIHAKYGLYADGDLQALGYDPEQGGGGATALYQLSDVELTTPINTGDGLVYNGTKWVNSRIIASIPQATSASLGGIKIGYSDPTVGTRNYAVALDNDGKAYVYVPWSETTTVSWINVTNTPTTISGYGITDAITTYNIGNQSVDSAVKDGNGDTISSTYLKKSGGTLTGETTFNNDCWHLAASENNVISNKHWNNGTLYNNANTAVLGTNYAIRNAVRFRWYGTYWNIGNIRDGGEGTAGFGIALEDTTNNRLIDCFRVTSSAAYVAGNEVIHAGNISTQSVNHAATAGGVAWSNVSGRPTAVSSFSNDAGYITSSGSCSYATNSGSAGSAGYITDGTMDIVAQNNNEINFGGSYNDSTIYVGYQSRGSKGVPTMFIFGEMTGTANLTCHYVYANEILNKTVNNVLQTLHIGSSGGVVQVHGNMGVGVSQPSYKLHVGGNIYSSAYIYAATDVQVTSDERRKEVIGDVKLTVEQIAKMPSVVFRWKKGYGDDALHIGTLAQSWEPVLPQAVGIGDDKERTRSFSYSSAAYAMAHADACEIVALKKRVEYLEKELKRQKSA